MRHSSRVLGTLQSLSFLAALLGAIVLTQTVLVGPSPTGVGSLAPELDAPATVPGPVFGEEEPASLPFTAGPLSALDGPLLGTLLRAGSGEETLSGSGGGQGQPGGGAGGGLSDGPPGGRSGGKSGDGKSGGGKSGGGKSGGGKSGGGGSGSGGPQAISTKGSGGSGGGKSGGGGKKVSSGKASGASTSGGGSGPKKKQGSGKKKGSSSGKKYR